MLLFPEFHCVLHVNILPQGMIVKDDSILLKNKMGKKLLLSYCEIYNTLKFVITLKTTDGY